MLAKVIVKFSLFETEKKKKKKTILNFPQTSTFYKIFFFTNLFLIFFF